MVFSLLSYPCWFVEDKKFCNSETNNTHTQFSQWVELILGSWNICWNWNAVEISVLDVMFGKYVVLFETRNNSIVESLVMKKSLKANQST